MRGGRELFAWFEEGEGGAGERGEGERGALDSRVGWIWVCGLGWTALGLFHWFGLDWTVVVSIGLGCIYLVWFGLVWSGFYWIYPIPAPR